MSDSESDDDFLSADEGGDDDFGLFPDEESKLPKVDKEPEQKQPSPIQDNAEVKEENVEKVEAVNDINDKRKDSAGNNAEGNLTIEENWESKDVEPVESVPDNAEKEIDIDKSTINKHSDDESSTSCDNEKTLDLQTDENAESINRINKSLSMMNTKDDAVIDEQDGKVTENCQENENLVDETRSEVETKTVETPQNEDMESTDLNEIQCGDNKGNDDKTTEIKPEEEIVEVLSENDDKTTENTIKPEEELKEEIVEVVNNQSERSVSDNQGNKSSSRKPDRVLPPSGEVEVSSSTNSENKFSVKDDDNDMQDEEAQGDWGWDSWADDFIIQTASKVSSLLETVEGQLGIPDPADLAKVAASTSQGDEQDVVEQEVTNKPVEKISSSTQENTVESTGTSSWFSSFVPVSAITNLVQSTGTEFVSGGIDALEFIGKKTVNMLSEGDPGLRNKRDALMRQNKPNLSQILQEARDNSEKGDSDSPKPSKTRNPKKFNDMFDKFQGLANLDALEMLSNECQTKLDRILNVQSDEAREDSEQIIKIILNNFEPVETQTSPNKDNDDFKKSFFNLTKKLQLKVTCSKFLNTYSKLKERSAEISTSDENEVYERCVASLAEITSRVVEYYRKIADMLMLTEVQAKELAGNRALALRKIASLFDHEVTCITNNYAQYLAEKDKDAKVLTDIYLEGSNCSSFLEDSHQLLLPMLKLSAIK